MTTLAPTINDRIERLKQLPRRSQCHSVQPAPAIDCYFCGDTVPDLDTAAALDWQPSFWRGEQQISEPVCPACCKTHLRLAADGEMEERQGVAVYLPSIHAAVTPPEAKDVNASRSDRDTNLNRETNDGRSRKA